MNLLDQLWGSTEGWRAVSILLIIAISYLAKELANSRMYGQECNRDNKTEIVKLLERTLTVIAQNTEAIAALKSTLDIYQRLDTLSDYVKHNQPHE